jgi:hypothetical protein
MKIFILGVFITLILTLNSCFLRPNCSKKYFIVNNQEFIKSNLKTNGVYVSINKGGAFFLFDDGKIQNHSTNKPNGYEFWSDPEKEISKVYDVWYFNRKDGWGNYIVNNDSIFIQFFNYHNQEPCKRWVYEQKGVTLNDSTIEIFSTFMHYQNEYLYTDSNIYRFFPTIKKPNDKKAWLFKKHWYKKGLHESRK